MNTNAIRGYRVLASVNQGFYDENGELYPTDQEAIQEMIQMVGGTGAVNVLFDGETSVWAIVTSKR